MNTRQELKEMAKQQIKGKIGILFVITLIISVISSVAGSILPFVGTIIISSAFTISTLRIYQGLLIGKSPEVNDAFAGFDDFWTALKANLLVGVFTFLWSLLFYIPGIIKAISYSQTMMIVAENPGISAREALNRSKQMMEGHKMDYFVLELSFIGWLLLSIVTFGIALIWVVPYMQATFVTFYADIKTYNN